MNLCSAMKLLFVSFVLCAAAANALAARSSKECMWHDYIRHDNVSAWEFQAQPHRHKIRNRDKAINHIEQILQSLTNAKSGVQSVPNSRWMAIFKETSFMLTTRHGHPLHRDPEDKHAQPFPWKGIGYLRLRNYQILTPAGAYVPAAMSGMADLTFKMKKVDPDIGPGKLQLPRRVGEAKITAKVENDMHCDHGRATMSPLFRPVSQTLNISKIANVKNYFPNLAQVTMLDENEGLPFMHEVYRAKIVWTVVYEGVVGEANLVIKYNTSFQDAVAGASPKNGELSLRIRREVAEATGTTGEEGKQKLYKALDVIGDAMQAFRDAGWDGKTPSLPSKKHKSGGKPDEPCAVSCKTGCHCQHIKADSSGECACKDGTCKHCSCTCCDSKHSGHESVNRYHCKQCDGCCCGCQGSECKHTTAATCCESAAHQGRTVPSWLQGWWREAATWLPTTARNSVAPTTQSRWLVGKHSVRQQLLLADSGNILKPGDSERTPEQQEQEGGGIAESQLLDDYGKGDDTFMPDTLLTEQLVSEEVNTADADEQLLDNEDIGSYEVDNDTGNDELALYDAEVDDWERIVPDATALAAS